MNRVSRVLLGDGMLLMIQILQYLKDPKLWESWYIFLIMGNAGFISPTVESIILHDCEMCTGDTYEFVMLQRHPCIHHLGQLPINPSVPLSIVFCSAGDLECHAKP